MFTLRPKWPSPSYDEFELRPLLIRRDRIALFGGGKTALGRDAELVDIG
ncbi:MAG: hypothetical protein U5M50_00855 [Sphingobium sp.]|nr:hypothetical protein [Sphingobium sp.]